IVEARKRGMKTVVVDPRRIGIGANADMLLQVRPGTDGALALAIIHCLIEESWYDVEFVRRWTNGVFLLNTATGAVVTEADLDPHGSTKRFVIWDEAKNESVLYDSDTGAYARDGVRPALFGARTLTDKAGTSIVCTTVFERLGEIAAQFAPEK